MTQYALGIQYDGSQLHGWQRQARDDTVQGFLERAISQVADHPVTLRAAGRTDAGVHATGQVAAFASSAEREPEQWRKGINALTPACIDVTWVRAVDDAFHPRYSATARAYVYLFNDAEHDPFLAGLTWCTGRLDADAMHREAQALIGEHDFSAFRAAGCQSLTPMRRVDRCEVRRVGEFVALEIEANAYLLHMVRNVAAALSLVGQGRAGQPIAALLAARDRGRVAPTAPPQGLYLHQVRYPGRAFPPGKPPPLLRAV